MPNVLVGWEFKLAVRSPIRSGVRVLPEGSTLWIGVSEAPDNLVLGANEYGNGLVGELFGTFRVFCSLRTTESSTVELAYCQKAVCWSSAHCAEHPDTNCQTSSLHERAYVVSCFCSFSLDRILVARASDTPAPMEISAAVA